jgi:hypothetical protein
MSPPYLYTYKPPCPAIMRPPEGPSGAEAGVPVFRSDVDPRSGRFDKALDRGGRHRRLPSPWWRCPGCERATNIVGQRNRVGRGRSPDGRDSSIKWSQRSKSASKHFQGARTGCAATGALGKSGSDSAYSSRPASPPGRGPSEVAKNTAALAFVVGECCGSPVSKNSTASLTDAA